MALIVQKFGGTSVGSVERIRNVARRVAKWKAAGHDLVVVPSAMAGETDRLIALAKELQALPDPRELDVVAATGEQVTIGLLAMALMDLGVKARSYTGWQVKIVSDSAHNKARIVSIDQQRIRADLHAGYVVAGAGSKVLQIRAVEFAGKYRVPTRVLSSLTNPALPVEEEAQSGTLITFEEDPHMAMEKAVISGVAFNRDEAKITVHDVPDRPGVAYAILGPIAEANIDVDVIVQNIGHDGMTDLSFTVHRTDYAKAMKLLKSQVQPHIKCRDVTGDDRIAKVSIVGMGMRSHAGIAAQMFRTLAEEGINIQMISTSEIKITVVIEEKYTELAVRVLHKAFELDQE